MTARVITMTAGKALGAGLLALGLAAAALAVLPLMADELPRPLDVVARLPERLWTRIVPPRVPRHARMAALTPAEQDTVGELAGRLDAMIVWSSNRSGTHQLYLLDLRDRSFRQLTRDDHVHFYSRFSPDGRWIAFMQSQQPWASYREERVWDIHVIGVDGTQQRRLAADGYAPAWTPDGQAVLFSRGNRTIRVDPVTGRESVLFDADQAIPGARILGVSLSADGGRLAFTSRGVYDGVAVYDLARRRLIPLSREEACQVAWAPDGAHLAWIEVGGAGGTRVMAGQPDGAGRTVLMDLPGRYSHEYFPAASNDGRWLIWGAAAEGHEHDRADYEIFLWAVGTPWEQATRLTHHPANDQWPDLHVRRSAGQTGH